MAGKTLKFGGSGLVEGQHTWYETVLPDADGEVKLEGDRVIKGKTQVVRADPGHEVEADRVMRITSKVVGQKRVEVPWGDGYMMEPVHARTFQRTAEEYVARQQASYVTGAATATSGPAKGAPAKS